MLEDSQNQKQIHQLALEDISPRPTSSQDDSTKEQDDDHHEEENKSSDEENLSKKETSIVEVDDLPPGFRKEFDQVLAHLNPSKYESAIILQSLKNHEIMMNLSKKSEFAQLLIDEDLFEFHDKFFIFF